MISSDKISTTRDNIATAGDRRDEDMRELGRVAARHFDDVIIREDKNTRGRRRGETAGLIRRASGRRSRRVPGPAAPRS